MSAQPEAVILFSAFEPSGDAHAAGVIAELVRRGGGGQIFACGGPRMERAGASILERTADIGAMGLNALRHWQAFRGFLARMRSWSASNRVVAHVPVDSPAANGPLSRVLRQRGARVIHLVAPQLWAWGPWRLGRLRRTTSGVMCLLPFEEEWFRSRRVPARFIGHPTVNRRLDAETLATRAATLPQGSPRIAILPGSREHEVRANVGQLYEVFRALRREHAGLVGVVAAATAELAETIRRLPGERPEGLRIAYGETDAVIGWCDLALAVSGTVTLDVALQRKPMVGVYWTGRLSRLGARVLIRTPHRLLPNIVAGREIVPEFVPYSGGPEPVVAAAARLLRDPEAAEAQRRALDEVVHAFDGHRPAREAADMILEVVRSPASVGATPARTSRSRSGP